MTDQPNDPVNHPKHYTQRGKVECIDVIENLPYNRAAAMKYLWRAGDKDTTLAGTIQDLEKAAWYVAREISRIKGATETKAPAKKRGRPAKKAQEAAPVATDPNAPAAPPKRRGRPPGSKNKAKEAAPVAPAEQAPAAPAEQAPAETPAAQ